MTSHRGGRSGGGAADHRRRDRCGLLDWPFHSGSRLGCGKRSGGSSSSRMSHGLGRDRGWGSHHSPACRRLDILHRASQRVHFRSNVVDLLQVQPWGQRRLLRYWRRLHGRGRRSLCHFGFSRSFATVTEMRSDFARLIVIERAGMRFLVRNSQLGQVLYNHVALHFQFTRQFVDPNLPHA